MAHNFHVCHKSNILFSAAIRCEDKIISWLGSNLNGQDDDVAGGGEDEEKMREVDQPRLVQEDWVALESLHNGARKTRINRIILFFLTMTIS